MGEILRSAAILRMADRRPTAALRLTVVPNRMEVLQPMAALLQPIWLPVGRLQLVARWQAVAWQRQAVLRAPPATAMNNAFVTVMIPAMLGSLVTRNFV